MEPWTAYFISEGFLNVKSLVIVPKVPALLSIGGSAYIIQDTLKNPNKRTNSTYHRLMVGLSLLDIIFSFSFCFLSSWPMPKGYFIMAAGSLATCDVSAFFSTIGIFGVPLYNCSLATYYLLQLKYNCSDSRIKAIEKWLHVVPWLVGVGAAISGLCTNAFGPFLSSCWVTYSYPIGCELNESPEKCIRGGTSAKSYFWYGYIANYFFALCYVSASMLTVYRSVLQVERKLDKHRFSSLSSFQRQQNDRKRSRRILLQAALYSMALVLLLIFPIMSTVYWQITGKSSQVLSTLLGIINPLQGFFNLLVYLIPAFQNCFEQRQKRKKKAEKNMILQKIIKSDQDSNDCDDDIDCESTDDTLFYDKICKSKPREIHEEEEKEEIIPKVFELYQIA